MRMNLLMFVFLVNLAFSFETTDFKTSVKTYIHPEQISLSKQGIFINVNSHWIEMDAVYSDEKGIYIAYDERDWLHWKCPKCGHYNSSVIDSHCRNCGY